MISEAIIYLIPGLGADEKVFRNMKLLPFETKVIQWAPTVFTDTIAVYAQKLTDQIDLRRPVILIGVSMGGILAKEIRKIIDVKACIIISTIQLSGQFNPLIKMGRYLPLHRIIPVRLMKSLNKLTASYFFSVRTPVQKKALRKTIEGTDLTFLKWSIHALINWNNNDTDEHLLHIHGTHDRIFPLKYIHTPVHKINKGGHWMIVDRAKEIETIVLNYLSKFG